MNFYLDAQAVQVVKNAEGRFYDLTVHGELAGLLIYHVPGSRLIVTQVMVKASHKGRELGSVHDPGQ